MKNLRLKHLFDGYLSHSLSAEEEQEFFDLLSSKAFDEEVKDLLSKEFNRGAQNYSLDDGPSQRILSSILGLRNEEVNLKNTYFHLGKLKWAAAIIIIASGITFFYTLFRGNKYPNSIAKLPASIKYKNDVSPGTNGAILKLADGSVVTLDSTGNKSSIHQGNTTIVKHDGSLSYISNNQKDQEALGYNMVETPRGHQFHLRLEDGSKVWLNAASSINFPVVFTGNERDVTITGEVYFEVAKNKQKPFHVSVNGSTVEVLGTHFNINSYEDDGTIKTTLLEGSVKITRGNNQKILRPGQQARINAKGELTAVNDVNTEEVVAWKNNYFSFNNIDIKKLMKQLSRWYDVQVVFKGETKDSVTFKGDISRSVNLSNVLKMLESTGEVAFSVEDKKITVIM